MLGKVALGTYLLRYRSVISALFINLSLYVWFLQVLICHAVQICRTLVILLTTSLQELFSKFGDVISYKIVRNEDGIMGLFNLHRKNKQMQQSRASTTPISVIGNCTFYVDLL
jgi:hypothetical protein